MHDLLNDPLIGIRTVDRTRAVELPQLLALLSAGEVDGYTGLRAHQADPWHVFLVQLAAGILARRPQARPPADPTYWREGLLELAEGHASAWHLVEEDVTKPAFLQHPWNGWDAEGKDYGVVSKRGSVIFDPKACTPDELDVLVTAKNHDVKASRFAASEPEAWLYALLMYQTTSGFLGAGNYGIVRMNGGFASRPVVSWVSDLHPSRRFAEELEVVRAIRERVLAEARFGFRPDGHLLTWLQPWNRREHQYTLADLEPCFIEACRPVRLRLAAAGALVALGATSGARQIGPKSLESGDVGDPWTPLNVEDRKKGSSALTLSAGGFTPKLVTDLLFKQGFDLTALQEPRPGEAPGWFVGSVLVRGQGKTEGFHRLELPIPAKARLTLMRPKDDPTRRNLAELSKNMLSDAKDAAAALRTALTVLAEGGPDQPDFDRDAIKRWIEAAMQGFGRQWPHHYFPTLWQGCDMPVAQVGQHWRAWLVQSAQKLLADATARLPLPSNRRWRAITQSRSALFGVLRKKNLLPDTSTFEEEAA
jgi:CRISPR system Cascade subunit CasA